MHTLIHIQQCLENCHLSGIESIEHCFKRSTPRKIHVHDLEIGLEIQPTHDII